MKYSPKKIDTPVRAIYAALIIFSIISISRSEGAVGIILRSISIVTLSLALYLFIRYDMTTYTYILNERGTDFDFIINKSVGRRGNYVCYCYMSDCVFFEKRTKNIKKVLREKYKGISIYNFSQNVVKKDDYVIVFLTEGKYDAIFFEPGDEYSHILADAKANAQPYEGNVEDDENYEPDIDSETENLENIDTSSGEISEMSSNEINDIDNAERDEIEAQGIEYEE